jgi:hypothetical protein
MSEDKPRYSVKKSWQRLKPEDLTYSVGERPMAPHICAKLAQAIEALNSTEKPTVYVLHERKFVKIYTNGKPKKAK